MLQSSCQQSDKGKQKGCYLVPYRLVEQSVCIYLYYLTIGSTLNNTVDDDNNKSHRTRPNGMPWTQTGLFIREPTCVTHLSYSSSSDDEVTNQSAAIFPTNNGLLTSIEDLERGESSKGKSKAKVCVYVILFTHLINFS